MNKFLTYSLITFLTCVSLALVGTMCYISYRCFQAQTFFYNIMGVVLTTLALAQFSAALWFSCDIATRSNK